MKTKILTVLLIGLLVFSTVNLALARVKCPDCKGAGSIDCTKCDGTGIIGEAEETTCERCDGEGVITPSVVLKTVQAEQTSDTTYATGTFENKEDFDVEGKVKATLSGHSNTSETITFPAGEQTAVTVGIDYVGSYTMQQLLPKITMTVTGIDEIDCPTCDGTGTITEGTECNKCDGTGLVDCPTCEGSGYIVGEAAETAELPLATIGAVVGGVVAVVVVGVVAFLFLKKRRVNEKTLRRYSSSDFNAWVLKRLDGKPATSKDIAMGIDGYSAAGYPVAIRQTDGVGMNAIDNLASSLARSRARNGVIVAFSFGGDAVRGKVRARTNYGLDIQMLTVNELIYTKRPI